MSSRRRMVHVKGVEPFLPPYQRGVINRYTKRALKERMGWLEGIEPYDDRFTNGHVTITL